MVRFVTLTARTYDIDDIDGSLSFFGAPCKSIMINVQGNFNKEGIGKCYVDGIKTSRPVLCHAQGFKMLLLPVGEVMREYDHVYEVELADFKDDKGNLIKNKKFKVRTNKKKVQDPKFKENDEKTLIAAREAMVLLKNKDHVLPLKKDETLNLFGDISTFRITAFGAPKINPRWSATFLDGIQDHSDFKVNEEVSALYSMGKIAVPEKQLLERAKEKSPVAIIYLTRKSGENVDNRPIKGEYYLTDEEREMIKAVTSVFEKTVLILNCGYPIEMGFIDEFNISSVIYTGFSGMTAAYALMEILDGRTDPSGKLPTSFPYDYYDTAASKNFVTHEEGEDHLAEDSGGIHTYYCEDIYVGYRYFDTFGKKCAYGFGHGLSYTEFEIKPLHMDKVDDGFELHVRVSNKGKYPGKEVVEVYQSISQKKYELVKRGLCAFEKTKLLDPGESQDLCIKVDEFTLSSYIDDSYMIPEGMLELYVGGSLEKAEKQFEYEISEDRTIRKADPIASPVKDFPVLTQKGEQIPSLSKRVAFEDRIGDVRKNKDYRSAQLKEYKGKRILWKDVRKDERLLDDFVAQMSLKELCTLNCNGGNHWMPWQDGCAGALPAMKKYGIKALEVSDANAGVNVKKPNIGFPQSSGIAATFNKQIAYMVGETIARESMPYDIVINLGPGFNIHRNILNGRNSEYFSEDPYLSGTMAGYQGKGLEENGIGSTYKHLFCNNAETLRKSNQSIVSQRALREIYFKNFEYAFKVHKPVAVMNSYNALNGIYPAASSEMMQDLMRKELGFDGIIMTDWDSYATIDVIEMVKSGTCWVSSGGKKYAGILYKAAKAGKIDKGVLQENAKYVIRSFMKFDRF